MEKTSTHQSVEDFIKEQPTMQIKALFSPNVVAVLDKEDRSIDIYFNRDLVTPRVPQIWDKEWMYRDELKPYSLASISNAAIPRNIELQFDFAKQNLRSISDDWYDNPRKLT